MTAQRFAESAVEDAAHAWLESLGYAVLHGPDIAVGMPAAERGDPNYRKYGYPPDKQEKATQTVLEQAEVLSQKRSIA